MNQQDLFSFYDRFSTKEKCEFFLKEMIIKNNLFFSCPHCGNADKIYITNRGYKCAEKTCHKKFTIITGTIFENTKIPLNKWFFHIYHQASNKKNISSRQIAKDLGLTPKSAWDMSHKIRQMLGQDENIKLKGIIEIDEAFLSKGGTRWTRWGGICTRKLPIIGMIERGGGRLIIKEVPNRKRETIFMLIDKYCEEGSIIYTDGAPVYKTLEQKYKHEFVEHSTREYVRGDVHTNNIEGVWRMLKSNIRHAHHQVSQKHLQLYCNELCYRRNTKHLTDDERFNDIILRCLNNKSINYA